MTKHRRLIVAVYDENKEPIILGPVDVVPTGDDRKDALDALVEIMWCSTMLGEWPIGE